MIRIVCSLALSMVLLACQQAKSINISAEKLKVLQKEGITVIDIRTNKEYASGHIAGVTINIDYLQDDFLEKMEAYDKDEPIIIHCAKGGRSGRAAALLLESGFDVI